MKIFNLLIILYLIKVSLPHLQNDQTMLKDENTNIPSVEFLTKKFSKNPLFYKMRNELPNVIHFILSKSPYPINFNYGLIGQIVQFWDRFGRFSGLHCYSTSIIPGILDYLFNYTDKYEGQSISQFSLYEIESVVKVMKEKCSKTFALGIFRWTSNFGLLELIYKYEEKSNGRDRINEHNIINAEMEMISKNNFSRLKKAYEMWKSPYSKYDQDKQINEAEKEIKYYIFCTLGDVYDYGKKISQILNLDVSKAVEIKNVAELIPTFTKIIFDINIEYNNEKEFIFEKYDFNIKITTIDLEQNEFDNYQECIIYNGKEMGSCFIFNQNKDLADSINFYIYKINNGVVYYKNDEDIGKTELIIIPMTNDNDKEYNEGIKYEICERKLEPEEIEEYNSLPELSFSSLNFVTNSNENEIKIKMKVNTNSRDYRIKTSNVTEIHIFLSSGRIKYGSYLANTNEYISFTKGEIIFIYMKPAGANIKIILDFTNEHAIDLPFQPLKIKSRYDNSYTASNPLKAGEITYNKRKGEAIYIYCNNPEHYKMTN